MEFDTGESRPTPRERMQVQAVMYENPAIFAVPDACKGCTVLDEYQKSTALDIVRFNALLSDAAIALGHFKDNCKDGPSSASGTEQQECGSSITPAG